MKQIYVDHSQIDIADIFRFYLPFFLHAVSGKYHALQSTFQALIATHYLYIELFNNLKVFRIEFAIPH